MKLRGIKLTQSRLENLRENSIQTGQRLFHQSLIILILIVNCILLGAFSGAIGAILSFNFVNIINHRLIYLSILLILIQVGWVLYKQRDSLQGFIVGLTLSWTILPCLVLFLLLSGLIKESFLLFVFPTTATLLSAFLIAVIVGLSICFCSLKLILSYTPSYSRIVISSLQGLVVVVAVLAAVNLESSGSLQPNSKLYLHLQDLPEIMFTWLAGLGGTVTAIGSCYVAQSLTPTIRSVNGSLGFARQLCWVLATWGGTSFYNLDLSQINFANSKIANSDFRAGKLYRTCLRGVEGLEYARVDSRYLDLEQPKVQELLTLGRTRETNFQRTILRGAYLQEADLRDIDFTEANLDGADLRNADLRRAIFIRTIVTDVDFSGADLTGCCIKDWSFNRQTQFTGITCDYIYRSLEQNRPIDRYPIDRNFEPGEFESMLQRIDTSFEFVVRDRLDPLALSFAFEKFRLEDEGLGLELQGVEQRGDVWIVKVGHKAGISPQQVEQHVNDTYEDLRTLFETRYQLAISAKESEISRLNQTLNEVLQRFMQRSAGNFTIGGEGNRIYVVDEVSQLMESQNINAGRDVDLSSGTRVNVGGDVSGTLNLGEISGTVTNLVQQLNNSSVAEQQDLGSLLQNLQTAIEAESDLPEEQKKDALDAVATLAEEGKKTAENRTTKLCSMAVNALKGITSSLSDASKLAECFQISLPLIKALLGLP